MTDKEFAATHFKGQSITKIHSKKYSLTKTEKVTLLANAMQDLGSSAISDSIRVKFNTKGYGTRLIHSCFKME